MKFIMSYHVATVMLQELLAVSDPRLRCYRATGPRCLCTMYVCTYKCTYCGCCHAQRSIIARAAVLAEWLNTLAERRE